jgi:putative membrane protein
LQRTAGVKENQAKGVQMIKFIIRWAINAAALYVAALIVPGIVFEGDWMGIVWLALIITLLNALLRPVLKLLTLPLIILTLGLFTVIINTLVLILTSSIGHAFGLGLTVDGFWPALLGSLVISIVSMVMSAILRDELKGRKRND